MKKGGPGCSQCPDQRHQAPLHIRTHMLSVRVAKHWHRLPRGAVESPSLERLSGGSPVPAVLRDLLEQGPVPAPGPGHGGEGRAPHCSSARLHKAASSDQGWEPPEHEAWWGLEGGGSGAGPGGAWPGRPVSVLAPFGASRTRTAGAAGAVADRGVD